MVDMIHTVWRKSSHSGAPDEGCLEVADLADGGWVVRNSKDPAGPTLRFTPAEWAVFITGVRDGKFD
jgi:Domain of unknown function (DUF397)